MSGLKILILVIALIQGLWLTFDGSRALLTGDYTTARSGPRSGQLGPWSKLVAAAGINPRSTMMKAAHLVLGLGWLIALSLVGFRVAAARQALMICSAATLWYLPLGTVLSLIELVLLLVWGVRK